MAALGLSGFKYSASRMMNSPVIARILIKGIQLEELPASIVNGFLSGKIPRTSLPAEYQRLLEELTEAMAQEFGTTPEGKPIRVPSRFSSMNRQMGIVEQAGSELREGAQVVGEAFGLSERTP